MRPVGAADLERWVRLRRRLWPERPESELREEAVAYLRGEGLWGLPGATWPSIVLGAAEEDGSLVGFVEATLRPFAEECETSPVGYLEGWYVEPAHRRRGIGRRLVRAAEAWAVERGCEEMASDADTENVVSAAGHRALGYEVVARTVHFRRPLSGPPGDGRGP
ncbi:MAG TPA: GNAT family N-acetyltransferase [Thermoplasmata archaeon]|nr:GNAT family N-acetyltransferase [Thermoplasmata archaeon]